MGRAPVTAPPEHPRPVADDARLGRREKVLLGVFFGVLIAAVVGSLVKLPYAIMSPGPIFNTLSREGLGGSTEPLIATDAPTYPTTGALDFTTVSVSGGPAYPVNAWDVAFAILDPDRDVFPVEDVYDPNATREQLDEENAVQMQGSQEEATAVALRALGKTVPLRVVVASMLSDSPAKDVLRANDTITRVGTTTVAAAADVPKAIQQVTAGQPVAVQVVRDGKTLNLTVPTRAGQEGRTMVGARLGVRHDFPVKVTINAGDVGGPSAGLMFALGIYDLLSPGPLTGGKQIAGTGTISEAGAVGPIGGIKQKLAGARESGAEYFLAPADNCPQVIGNIPDGLTVVKVAAFADAKAAVEKIAAGQASGLPACS